ncbi:MAG: phosphoribosylformylglycinamidine synthase [Clostridia bacterium]|nr:phosphoribosylformylglycinamidine synthase [Clostridia bacterium]
MVYRVFTERKRGFAAEAARTLSDIRELLGVTSVTGVRLLNRYDAEGMSEADFRACLTTVFSEPQTDDILFELPQGKYTAFAVEYLPGQFDQRADSCAQCIQLACGGERPAVRSGKVYLLEGDVTPAQLEAVKKYIINPVESREASFGKPDTLRMDADAPADVAVLDGFTRLDDAGLDKVIADYRLAMDSADIAFCRDYFRGEGRDPSLTELRMLDTYWSDHCRHTTFGTVIESVELADPAVAAAYARFEDMRRELGRTKPVTLMELATIGAKYLKAKGLLTDLDESEEINACTVKIKAVIDGEAQDWLLLFKNETHNHPTEIEPFGGAATCIGGAIRDPLSGRAYVYQAMRVTGASDPTVPISETLSGKLPQRKIVTEAAAGYSSYGNQIGLATGLVDEIYHPGYAAKRMEIGAVVGAAPARNVRREVPAPGDVVILLGGRTGRDGCGGATGSSKSHSVASLEQCGAEVQKGNAPEERKLQRLFRNSEAARLIKRCNDFGAGGVSVAIGELADGMEINLDLVPKKYDGLDGTELAISESQERMAVVLAAADKTRFLELAAGENLEAVQVAEITAEPRLVMKWRGKTIVDISREFLNSSGAPKYTSVRVDAPAPEAEAPAEGGFAERVKALASDLNVCSKRGLSERFDSTIGAATLLSPFGGKRRRTPAQAMAALLPADGETDACSIMAYGFEPYRTERDPYAGSYTAVAQSMAKVIAAGGKRANTHLTFQEYFQRLGAAPENWGKPFAALLGALDAQIDLSLAAIGGKDSMSGSFEKLHVPPTLVSFAVASGVQFDVIAPEFKRAGARVFLLRPDEEGGRPTAAGLTAAFDYAEKLIADKKAVSAYVIGGKGAAEGVMKCCFGNGLGFAFADGADPFAPHACSFILEVADGFEPRAAEGFEISLLGVITDEYAIAYGNEKAGLSEIEALYEGRLESVFHSFAAPAEKPPVLAYEGRSAAAPAVLTAKPRVFIPVFPGTNCEYDTARAFEKAGAEPDVFVLRNLTAADIAASASEAARRIARSQIIFIPGGFSGGDEPDGSGKFITAFFRSPAVSEATGELLDVRKGLMGGICNGFQALVKLGLLPYGRIREATADSPTLTYNVIGRHQSRMVLTRVASALSPWLSACEVGDVHLVPVSHGEGRFVAPEPLLRELADNGQIATQYCDAEGTPSGDIEYNPNGSYWAVEGITSADGRIFGKMGHSERVYGKLYKNIPHTRENGMFASAVRYFKG